MKLQLALLSAAMAVGVSAQASLLVHEPFDDAAGVSLAGSGSGTGWGGDWTHQVSGNIKYAANMNFSSLATSGGSAMLEGPFSINADHAITRAVSFAGAVGDTVLDQFSLALGLSQWQWRRPDGWAVCLDDRRHRDRRH